MYIMHHLNVHVFKHMVFFYVDNGYSSEKTPTNDTKESNVHFTALVPNG